MADVELDPTFIDRAAPAGSMHYFSLLFASPEQRSFLAALYVIESELRESSLAAHEVAHTRLQWWREEIGQLSQRRPRHPATRALLQLAPELDYQVLQEPVLAAAMDLACATFDTEDELTQYFHRSGGALFELAARYFVGRDISEPARLASHQAGALIRQTETWRDLRRDIHRGRIYLPLDTLDQAQLTAASLRQETWPPALLQLLQSRAHQQLLEYRTTVDALLLTEKATLRPVLVLAGLHARLARKMVRQNFSQSRTRVELHPFDKLWTAWRTARTAR
jgi:phytoene synthase